MMDSADRAAARASGRNLSLGILLMVVVGGVGGVGSFLISRGRWWLPPGASAQAVEIDRLFYTTLAVTGIAFVLVHVVLALFVWQGGRTERAADFPDHRTLELTYTLAPAAILITLISMGAVVWARVHQPAPANALVVEVRGGQFGWGCR